LTDAVTRRLAAVAIGRNEGERLRRCLRSLAEACDPVIYVDSASSDDSVRIATELGAVVVRLDGTTALTAARGRNAGFERLRALRPDAKEVFFIDGDCEMVPGWPSAALAALDASQEVAAVCGRLRERFPEMSLYNRMCDLEWAQPVGVVKACGGIFVVRTATFAASGGFNASLRAGEEPELCRRLRDAGCTIVRLPDEMALHDAALLSFSAWWRRQTRNGRGAAEIALRFGNDLFGPQLRSARLWTLGFMAAAALMLAVGTAAAGPLGTMVGVLASVGLLLTQITRVAWNARRRGLSLPDAASYGVLSWIGKWAQLLGQLRYAAERRRTGLSPGHVRPAFRGDAPSPRGERENP